MPAASPMPAEVMKCFEGKPGAYGRDIVSTAGYMFKGEDQVNISTCAAIKPASGFDGLSMMDLVRNPNAAGLVPPQLRRRGPVPDRRELDGHLQQDRGRLARHRDLEHPVAGRREVQHRPEPEEVPPHQRRRPHLVPDDEPDAGPVRRRSRPQGDELGHRQGRSAAGVGRPYLGPIANHIIPDAVFTTSSPTTSRTAPLVTTAAPRRRWRR